MSSEKLNKLNPGRFSTLGRDASLNRPPKQSSLLVPQHVVLFPDGNRRWARERNLDTLQGHKEGYKKLVDFCRWCIDRGVKVITAYGFSTENWNRPEKEVSYLMRLLEQGLKQNFSKYSKDPKLREMGVRIRVSGERERLPKSLQEIIKQVEKETKENTNIILNLAVSYGGRWDIVQAVRALIKEGKKPEEVTEEEVSRHLSTAGLPDPDLVIRPGGEKRFSNFVLWQAAYAELHFCPKYWPDFSEEDLDVAFAQYANRQRRFGR